MKRKHVDPAVCVSVVTLPAVGRRVAAAVVVTDVEGTVYRLSPESYERFIGTERLTVVEEKIRRRLERPPTFDMETMSREPTVGERVEAEAARAVARRQVQYWRAAGPDARAWWRQVCVANAAHGLRLLDVIDGVARQLSMDADYLAALYAAMKVSQPLDDPDDLRQHMVSRLRR